MAIVLTVANQKGGVGKTTTAAAIAADLVKERKKKILLIDLDPQGNLSATFPFEGWKNAPGVYELISGGVAVRSVIHDADGIDIIPATERLANVDLEITKTGKEYRLRESLADIQGEYDYMIIDTAPSLGLLTINAFVASDYLIIPTSADTYSLNSIGQVYSTYEIVRKYCNNNLKIAGILLTRHNPRIILSQDMAQMIQEAAEKIGCVVLNTHIREGVAVREAQARHLDLYSYAPSSHPAKDYRSAVNELMLIIEKGGEDNG